MKKLITLLSLLPIVCFGQVKISDLTAIGTPASGDLFEISDIDAGPASRKVTLDQLDEYLKSTTKTLTNKTISGSSNTFSSIPSSGLADGDYGHVTNASGVITIDNDVITSAMIADGDWGDFSVSSNVATLDIGVLRYDISQSLSGGQILQALDNVGIDGSQIGTVITNGSGTETRKDNATSTNPAVGDDSLDGYSIGSRWYNTTTDTEWVALDVSAGAAVWLSTTNQFSLSNDIINDTHIDWGTGANQVSGADVPLADAGAFFATDNVEDALQQVVPIATNGAKKSFILTIDDVADSMDYAIAFVDAAFTITEVRAVHAGTGLSTPDIDVDIRHSTDRSAAGNQVETSNFAITSSTTGNSFTSGFEDATVPANSWIWIETSSQSGTTDNLEIVIIGTYD